MSEREELIPFGRVIWQSETAKTYQCPTCLRPIFSQYEGDESPTVICHGPMADHRLCWEPKADG